VAAARLSMSSHTVNAGSFRELIEATAEAGVPEISLTYQDYRAFSDAGESDKEMLRAVASNGARIVDIEALRAVMEADPTGKTAAYAERLMRVGEFFGASWIGSHTNFDGNAEEAADRLGQLCDKAAERGLSIGVEPVPALTLSDVAIAWNVVNLVGRGNVGLVLDTWHFSRGAGNLAMLHHLPPAAIKTVQISDGYLLAPPGVDYLDDTLRNRLPPGEGEFDLVGIIGTIADIATDIRWDMEICSSILDALPPGQAAKRAASATRSVLGQVLSAEPPERVKDDRRHE
jgi:sugar phosphate isomerase/epimerase